MSDFVLRPVLAALTGLALLALPAPQTPGSRTPGVRPEIRGMVVEPGTNAAVPDAEITLDFLGADRPRYIPAPSQATFTAKTDTSGSFVFHLDKTGYYTVRAKKEGFSESGGMSGAASTQSVTLTADAPSVEVRLYLARPARITGRVVEEESRKPIANLQVIAGRATNFAGRRMFMRSTTSTDAEGRFQVAALPGDYVVEIGPTTRGKDRILTKFSEADTDAVDQDFERTFWPGGHGEESALPVAVASGATVDLGPMPIKKVPYYRVHVRGAASNCEPEDTMQVYEAVPGYQGETNYLEIAPSIPCGAGMLISRFLPGSYRLILAINKRPRATRGMASAPFTVTDRNVEVIASLAPGIAVGGRFIAEDGARPPDFSALGIWLDPIGMLRFADLATPTRPGSDGKFHLEGVPAVDHRAVISGTGAGHYVKEIRFNGGPLRDGVVPLEQAALAHSLTIVIDDKPATLTGAVIAGDKAVSQPYLVLARWPLASGRVFVPAATTTGDSQGKFQFAGLAPGEYRVVSLRSMVEDRERAPGTLERALAVANKIELGPSAFQNITVEVSDLRK